MLRQRKIAAHYILCPRSGLIPRGVLTFGNDGTLIGVESNVERIDSMSGVEFYSGILIPGMINSHAHLELSHLKNKIPSGGGLAGFISEIASLRGGTSTEEQVMYADYYDSRMAKEGIVAVGDISNSNIAFNVKKRSRIRYHTFIEQFGLSGVEADATLGEIAGRFDLLYSLTPHSTYSLSETLFKNIISQNKKARLSIHFMESEAEADLFRGKGPLAERFLKMGIEIDFAHYGSPALRLTGSIPKNVPLLLIHNTFVTENDLDIISAHFTDVTWVVCPLSNAYIEGARPPLELLRRKGCRIAIGTDSLASNGSLSMAAEISHIAANYDIPAAEIIGWATMGGAAALGMESWLGSFEPGKSPGVVLIDSPDLSAPFSARRIL